MSIFEVILLWIKVNPIFTVFVSSFLFGDDVIYFLSILSGKGFIPLWIALVFSILGSGFCDTFWAFIARYTTFRRLKKIKFLRKYFIRIKPNYKSFSNKKLFMIFVFSKFFIGTRLMAIFYTVNKERNFKRVLFYNVFAVVLWIIVMSPIMFFIGKFTLASFDTVTHTKKIFSYAILIIIFLNLIRIAVMRTKRYKSFLRYK